VRAPLVRFWPDLADQVIFEFSDTAFGGLVGPDALRNRFTLDYGAGSCRHENAHPERTAWLRGALTRSSDFRA
jgi:hypothetical protein